MTLSASSTDQTLLVQPLNTKSFSCFGDVIEARGEPDCWINQGRCGRFHDRAQLDFAAGGRAGVSVFHGQPYTMPYRLGLVERHPLGSQAFLPMSTDPFLVIVADDQHGVPGVPQAFATNGEQGVNLHRGVWHGVLSPIGRAARFAVIDWVGADPNLVEFEFDSPWLVTDPTGLLAIRYS